MAKYLTTAQAEQFVRSKHPAAQRISVITHGYDNIVIIVDERLVYRFSRNGESVVSEQIEQKILASLNGMDTVHTPVILDKSDSPVYVCLSFLPGEHYSVAQVQQFTDNEKNTFVADLITFMSEMQKTLPHSLLTEVKNSREKAHDTWYDLLKIHLGEAEFPNNPELQQVARMYWNRWLHLCHHTALPEIMVHDDLHMDNLLFTSHKLSGVLDFADAGVGSAAQELRHLYRISEEMVLKAVRQYETLYGAKINPEEVITWAIATELSSYHEHMLEPGHPSLLRTRKNISKWLPGLL